MGRRVAIGASALIFAASAAASIAGCLSMAGMGETPMPGGWRLSAVWMPMCGQGWADAALSFVGMWAVMMVAMMLPSLAPMLWRQALSSRRRGVAAWAEAMVAESAGYFFVWTALGLVIFVIGAVFAQAAMQWTALAHAVPVAAGSIVVLAGASQFSAWKVRQLACVGHPAASERTEATQAGSAWQRGVRMGLQCCRSCAGLTAVLLVMGVMDWRVMTAMTVAITAERLALGGERTPKVIGAVLIGAGVIMLVTLASAMVASAMFTSAQ